MRGDFEPGGITTEHDEDPPDLAEMGVVPLSTMAKGGEFPGPTGFVRTVRAGVDIGELMEKLFTVRVTMKGLL